MEAEEFRGEIEKVHYKFRGKIVNSHFKFRGEIVFYAKKFAQFIYFSYLCSVFLIIRKNGASFYAQNLSANVNAT